ncbi:lytic transglycosylase domain-containing protein [Candidatus Binatia bacterium]|nr:lytic transglycosylase domain-containing protein [Candidatus Binatia bacterium]
MSGFADSFVTSFTSSYKKSSNDYIDAVDAKTKADLKAEQDKIKASVERFNTRRGTWLENENKDQEYRRIAMNTVDTYGGKVPADAWTTIYTELWNGRTIENIREDIDKKGFVVIENPETKDTGTVENQTDALINTAENALNETDTKSDVSVSESLWARQIKQESGGRQTDSEGNTLESPKGALGISQSLVTTAADPGFKAKSIFDLADEAGISYTTKDENTARALLGNKELNEAFGKGYMNAMLERYDGNEEKALIAYNFGPDNADKYNGDRSSLPEETQTYLKNILGTSDSVGGVVNNSANQNQDNWAIFTEDKANVMGSLGISEEMFDRTMKGFMPEFPAIKYAWGASPEEEKAKPDWQITSKIRKDNYIAFAAAAREANDETRATFIETVGGKLVDPAKPPKYLDPVNFTKTNAEGYLLAAEHALENATTDEAKAEAQKGIDLVKTYIERTAGPEEEPWYMKGELTESNVAGRIRKATAKGDMKALAYFNAYVRENTEIVPDNVTNAYVASKYAEMALLAARGDEDAKTDFNNWKTTDLPILITALRLNNKNDKPTTLVAAYDALAKAKETPDNTEAIVEAEKRIRDILNIDATKELNQNQGVQVSFIKREKDENGDFTGGFDQTSGYIKPDPENPGQSIFVDTDGNTLVGYAELRESVDEDARKAVQGMSVEIKTYKANRKQAIGAVRLFGDIASIVEEDERVLTSVAGLTLKVDSALRNVSVGIGLLDDLFQRKGGDADTELSLDEVQVELRKQGVLRPGQSIQDLAETDVSTIALSDNAKGLAQRKAIFEAKMILMTFRAGGLEGQSGQAMSNKDFAVLRQMLAPGGGKEAFMASVQSYINDRVRAVEDEFGGLGENENIARFFEANDYNPLNNNPASKNIRTLMNDPNADPRMKAGVDYLSREYTLVNTKPEEPPVVETPDLSVDGLSKSYRAGEAIVITPEFYEKYKDILGEFKIGDTIKQGGSN